MKGEIQYVYGWRQTFSNNNTGMIYNFFNEHFGEVRGMLIHNEVWVVVKDINKALGYKNTKDALIVHVDEEDKQIVQKS